MTLQEARNEVRRLMSEDRFKGFTKFYRIFDNDREYARMSPYTEDTVNWAKEGF